MCFKLAQTQKGLTGTHFLTDKRSRPWKWSKVMRVVKVKIQAQSVYLYWAGYTSSNARDFNSPNNTMCRL